MMRLTSALLPAIGAITIAASAQDRPAPPERPARPERPAVSAPQTPPRALAPVPAASPPPAPISEEHMRSTWSDGWRRLRVESRGHIELTDDERDVKSVSPNGFFEISSRGWLSLFGQRYTVRGNADGTTTRRFSFGASDHSI